VSLLSQVSDLEISHEDSLILIMIDARILSFLSSFYVSSTHQFFTSFTYDCVAKVVFSVSTCMRFFVQQV